MKGNALALGTVAALAVTGAVASRRRGSRSVKTLPNDLLSLRSLYDVGFIWSRRTFGPEAFRGATDEGLVLFDEVQARMNGALERRLDEATRFVDPYLRYETRDDLGYMDHRWITAILHRWAPRPTTLIERTILDKSCAFVNGTPNNGAWEGASQLQSQGHPDRVPFIAYVGFSTRPDDALRLFCGLTSLQQGFPADLALRVLVALNEYLPLPTCTYQPTTTQRQASHAPSPQYESTRSSIRSGSAARGSRALAGRVTIQVALPDAIRRHAHDPDFVLAWPDLRPDDGVRVVDDRHGNMLEILVAGGGKLRHPLSISDCIRAWQKLTALQDYFGKLRFPLRVYRGIRMTRSATVAIGFDGATVGQDVTSQAGNHWTVNRQIANRFATGEHEAANFEPDFEREGGLSAHEVLLSGVVQHPKDVDWHRTLTDYLVYTLGSEKNLNVAEEQVNSSKVMKVTSIPVRRGSASTQRDPRVVWGDALRDWLDSPAARATLRPSLSTRLQPWTFGGCRILAEALHHLWNGSQIVGVDAGALDDHADIVHMMVSHAGGYWDAHGFHATPRAALKWVERMADVPCEIVPHNPIHAQCIVSSDAEVSALVVAIRMSLGPLPLGTAR